MAVVVNAPVEYQFFSVKKPIIFGGKSYRPSICYKLTADIFDTVAFLAEVGDAVRYEKPVRFVSGRARDAAAKAAPEPVLTAPAVEVASSTVTVPADAGSAPTAGSDSASGMKASSSSRKRSSSASGSEVEGEFKDQDQVAK